MVSKRFYNIEELSIILGKSISAIHGHLARKQYDAVPQPIKLGRRLFWIVESVEIWIASKAKTLQAKESLSFNQRDNQPNTRRRGRPTKEEQKGRGAQ